MRRLKKAVLEQYRLMPNGIHGLDHWRRVGQLGKQLAQSAGGDMVVVEAFALVHDACRYEDSRDDAHGPRAARWIDTLRRQGILRLDNNQIKLLKKACRHHTVGKTTHCPTVGACWDADRLDLWRIGIEPDPEYLNTDLAKTPEFIFYAQKLEEGEVDLEVGW